VFKSSVQILQFGVFFYALRILVLPESGCFIAANSIRIPSLLESASVSPKSQPSKDKSLT